MFAYGFCYNHDVETNCIILEYAEFGSLHSGLYHVILNQNEIISYF